MIELIPKYIIVYNVSSRQVVFSLVSRLGKGSLQSKNEPIKNVTLFQLEQRDFVPVKFSLRLTIFGFA